METCTVEATTRAVLNGSLITVMAFVLLSMIYGEYRLWKDRKRMDQITKDYAAFMQKLERGHTAKMRERV